MVNPDPFVPQTYKSAMCFITSWIVLFLGVNFEFTPWGFVSGLMWVTGGVCGIFGIRNVGLAISVGTWSSVAVLVSFAWGMFLFDEKVKSASGTSFGVILLFFGFVEMAYYSSIEDDDQDYQDVDSSLNESLLENSSEEEVCTRNDSPLESTPTTSDEEVCTPDDPVNIESADQVVEVSAVGSETEQADHKSIIYLGMKRDKKVLGICGAAVDGILGGSNLIPMKLSPSM